MRPAYARADAIIAVSAGVAQDLAARLGGTLQRIHTRHNPIDTASLALKSTEPLNHPWFVADAAPRLVAARRRSHEKDLVNFMPSFALMSAQAPPSLYILGGSEQRQDMAGTA